MSELFSSILVPGFFLLACILQLHYFHRPFMQLTDPEHRPPPSARTLRWAHRCARPPSWGLGVCKVSPEPAQGKAGLRQEWSLYG